MLSYYEDTARIVKHALEQYSILRYGSANINERVDGYKVDMFFSEEHTDVGKIIAMIKSLPAHESAILIGKYGDPYYKEICADVLAKYISDCLGISYDHAIDLASMYFSIGDLTEKSYAEKYGFPEGSAHRKKMSFFKKINMWLDDGLWKVYRSMNGLYDIYTVI